MTRVATIPLQRTLSGAIQRSQQNLATSQIQLTSGKKAHDYAGLGIDAVRTLSARSMLAQQQSYQSVASRVGTTLSLYDANISQIDDSLSNLRTELMTALGTGDSPGIQHLVEGSFADVRGALNATEAGMPLFAGARTDDLPMVPETLADLAGMTPDQVFVNDQVRQSGRVGDGVDVEYGVVASDVGAKLVPAFQTLAAAGPFGDRLTDAQKDAIRQAIGELDDGLSEVRAVNAENGRKQNQVEMLGTRAKDREILLTDVIGSVEDADLGQVALDISQRQTILEASYSVFSQLSSLSLTQFLD
ncbi:MULTISPECIES: flagellin [unclassified Sphingobium]|uniref:flagellin n=1 Tax=unclassified Sphingobium TaxID=2611147 RepID=UPI0007F3889C|nr:MULTISPECIES: flagellin [unclassified Sphingobium]OAN52597.1 flagellin [Sphingobium sp. TCM1]WIW90918.1 flagellin [Sphingobium sp. V4]